MKKLLGLVLVAGLVFAFASCKKDYTCECTFTDGGTTSTASYTYTKVTKKDAEDACTAQQVTVGTATWSCELK